MYVCLGVNMRGFLRWLPGGDLITFAVHALAYEQGGDNDDCESQGGEEHGDENGGGICHSTEKGCSLWLIEAALIVTARSTGCASSKFEIQRILTNSEASLIVSNRHRHEICLRHKTSSSQSICSRRMTT